MSQRQKRYLRHRYKAVFGYTAFIVLCIGLLIMAPLLLAFIYPADDRIAAAFLLPGGILTILGGIIWWAWVPREPFAMTPQEGAVAVVFSWLVALFFGAVPFVFTEGLSFNQALFEATSGWTTTGLSVVDVTAAHPIVLFYRSLIQFAGGAGFAIIMLALISGPSGTSLSSAEGRGDQLVPHVRHSATIVLQLYIAYAVLGTIALWLVGMNLFDAVNHAFAALSTGGFSTRPESIGYWDSFAIEAVISILMILGTTNFLTAYAVVNGRWRTLVRSSEMRILFVLLTVGTLLLFWGTTQALYPAGKAWRVAFFEVISAISTCGFATVSYGNWRLFGWFLMTLLMIIGGGTGSTAGGIKLSRLHIAIQAVWDQIRLGLQPRAVIKEPTMWHGEQRIFLSIEDFRQALLLIFVHVSAVLVGALVLVGYDYGIGESLFEMMSSVSTIGLSVGITGVNAPPGALLTMTTGMFFGRLEFFAIFVGVTKFWRDLSFLIFKNGHD